MIDLHTVNFVAYILISHIIFSLAMAVFACVGIEITVHQRDEELD
jgi:hypothetical protein